MKFTNENRHQGDTAWFGIEKIPTNAKLVKKQFIAASERSGSFHALFGNYDQEDCILNHSLESELSKWGISLSEAKVLPKKDHRHTIIPKGVHFVGIQQRFDPLAGMKKRVID